jgi:hypothetical protein
VLEQNTMAPTTEDGNPTVGEAVDTGKLIPSTLPLETRCQPFPLRRLGGFWLPEFIVPGVAAVHARFGPRPDDVFLASFPKLGTTWLKALAFAVLTRDRHPPSDPEHPLRRGSPHECVRFLEMSLALTNKGDVFAAFPSPRVLATHLPYSLLPERIATCGRVVYVCRDPKDALVSGWLFTQRKNNMLASSDTQATTYTLETAFKLFCDGVSVWARSGATCSGTGKRAGDTRTGCSSSGTRRCCGTPRATRGGCPRSWAARSPARRRRQGRWTTWWSCAASID